MASEYWTLVEKHRSQFIKSLDADRLSPVLAAADVLTPADLSEVATAVGPGEKNTKLLDILRDKQPIGFRALCVVLETSYPHLLTLMFLGNKTDPQSLTSDSEEDAPTSPPTQPLEDDPGGGGGGGPAAGLRAYPHPHPHPHQHPHPHPRQHRPMSIHEVSMLKAELQLVTGDRGDLIRDRGIDDRQAGDRGAMLRDSELRQPRHKPPLLPTAAGGGDPKRNLKLGGESGSSISSNGGGTGMPHATTAVLERMYMHDNGPHGPVSSKSSSASSSMSVMGQETHSGREYERLKAKCDWAEKELQSLKRQHGETVKKCDQAVREADFFRHKYKLTKDKIDQLENELLGVKTDHEALLVEKQRYMLEVDELKNLHGQDQQEIEELEKQQREVMSESGSSEMLNTMYDLVRDKYKIIKQEYDELRKRYSELGASHNTNLSKLEVVQDDNQRLQKQYEEVLVDLNTAIIERKGLQTQCTAAIMKWHNAIHEKNELEKERDEYKKGHKQAVTDNIKTNKDIGRLRGERDAVVHEYSLIMSERDAVHKEIEQLNDKLSDWQRKHDELDKEKKSLALEVKSLRQEIASALHDRDHALKLLSDAQQQAAAGEQLVQDSKRLSDRELAGCGSRDTLERDQSSYEQTKAAETKELVSKEVDALRREIEQVQTELNDALSEAELSKRRRDWAFGERDKIVLERESIKTLCDELRRERDRAVSEQAQALRDLDDLRKQKNEATKELKEVKEKYELLIERENRKYQLNSVSHNHSRDSAIDADLQEWETETLELDIGTVADDDLGFDLCGGKDDPQLPNDNSIFISSIAKTGTAHGKLKMNDQLIRINNIDVTNTDKKVVLQAVKNGGSVINMVVRRRKSSTTRPIQPVHLHLTGTRELGISIESGLYISRILPGSVAAKEGNLAVGDRILNVNGQSVENLTVCDVLRLVDDGGDYVVLNVLKYAPTPQPSLVSSSASSGQILPESSPEAPASSPKSPRAAALWVTPSPEVAGKSLNIRTSGSQTDSLDSPQGGRSGATNASVTSSSSLSTTTEQHHQPHHLQHHHQQQHHQHHPSHHHQHHLNNHHGLESMEGTGSGVNNNNNVKDQPVPCGRACAKIFRDIYSTAELPLGGSTRSGGSSLTGNSSANAGDGGGGREHHHNGDLQNLSKSHVMALHSVVSSSVSTTAAGRAVDDEAADVGEEIQALIKQQKSKIHQGNKTPVSQQQQLVQQLVSQQQQQKKQQSRRDKEIENGGTWPKCRQNFDFQHINGPMTFVPSAGGSGGSGAGGSKKERPPLGLLLSDPPYIDTKGQVTSPASLATSHMAVASVAASVSMAGKVPPTPPERSDSFNRGKSIKHSPQNSDSVIKYRAHDAMPVSVGLTGGIITTTNSKSSPFIVAPLTSKQVSSDSHILSPTSASPASRSTTITSHTLDKKSLSLGFGEVGKRHYDHHPHKSTAALMLMPGMHFHGGSDGVSRGAISDLPPPLPLTQPPQHPPSSQSSLSSTGYPIIMDTSVKSAKLNAQEQVDYIRRPRPSRPTSAPSRGKRERREAAQKPTSLPVQPMYSPRPLPSSGGQHIVSTQPLPFRQGFTSPSPVKSVHSSGTTGAGHAGIWPLPHQQFPLTSPTSSTSSQPLSPRYTPPNGYPSSRSGTDNISDSEPERILYSPHDNRLNTPSPSPSQQSSLFNQSLQTLSDEFPPYPRTTAHWIGITGSHDHPSDGGCSTLPRHHRHFHGERTTPSSIEKGSDRESPIQPYSFLPKQSNSLPATMRHKRPQVGETRNIHVEKSQGPLGIQIDPSSTGGIFVSSVSENSLAAHAGIEVGDQLLEVCGINMRKAPYKLAASVLRQCRDSVTMLVQYNPEKYMEEESSDEPSSSDSSANNTPQTKRLNQASMRVGSDGSTITPQSLSPQSLSPVHSSKSAPADANYMPCEPRFVFITKESPQERLGTRFVGGNASGIFVASVSPNSSASGPRGLRCGDQILEFNGTNLRVATAEQAELEVSKPTDRVTILAQYNIAKYNAIHDKPGDAIYARALCDHDAEIEGELSFKKDDILFIDNTLFNGIGVWRAWLVDDEGNKLRSGTIPSKTRLEDELAHKRSLSDTLHDDELKGSRRGSASARRSFFRRKKHTRNNSKDSRELNSFSDASINSDSVPFLDDGQTMPFQRVERLDCYDDKNDSTSRNSKESTSTEPHTSMIQRPVLILGPLSEPLIEKLTSESPDKYCRCKPEIVRATQSSLETGKDKGVFLDCQRRDSHYECTRIDTIKEIIEKNRHAMLNCSPEAIERLHKVQIYPIVLFIRHKSPKQIREVKDTRFLPEKFSNKAAKELFELYQEYEQKYKMHFSECIPGGNLAYMSVNIKGAVDKHQRKTLWIPAGSI